MNALDYHAPIGSTKGEGGRNQTVEKPPIPAGAVLSAWQKHRPADRPDRTLSSRQRIKGLCGAKPPQKPRWTNAGRWAAVSAMEILQKTFGAWADHRGSARATCEVRPWYRGLKWRVRDDRQGHLEHKWDRRLRWWRGICVVR